MFDYRSYRWKKKRQHVLRRDHYVCQLAKRYGRIEEATHVHHIYPAEDYPEWAWSDWNLVSLSARSHNMVEDRTNGQLTELGVQLQRRTIPGVDWRKGSKMNGNN